MKLNIKQDLKNALYEDISNLGNSVGKYNWMVKKSADLTANPITISTGNVNSNKILMFSAQVGDNFESLSLGHGETNYGSNYITIDNTKVTVNEHYSSPAVCKTYNHGLTISKFINVIIETDGLGKATIKIETLNGNNVDIANGWHGCNGDVFAKCTNSSLTDCTLRWTAKNFANNIQIYSDSYGSLYSSRFPYYLVNKGYTSFVLDAFSGRDAAGALASLRINLEYSNPKYVVWLMGMNNPDSTTAVNNSWKVSTEAAMALCDERGIEMILATVPTVRGGAVDDSEISSTMRIHKFKNQYVKSSGKRYIDWDKAVGADENGNWYEGMLYTDGVHPTEKGAEALASRLIQDFPEVTISTGGVSAYDDTPIINNITSVQTNVAKIQDKINGNIKPEDTTFFNLTGGINLLNPETVSDGFINENGTINSSSTYKYTDFIKVEPGRYLIYSYEYNGNRNTSMQMRFVSCYNANKEYLRDLSTVNVNTWVIPEGVTYIRASFYASTYNNSMIEVNNDGVASSSYEEYKEGISIEDKYLFNTSTMINLRDKIYGNINPEDTSFFNISTSINFLNPATVNDGFINENGIVNSSSTYKYTDFIKVEPGKYLIYSYEYNGTRKSDMPMRFLSCYNENKDYLSSKSTVNVNTWVIPDGVSYIRASFYASTYNNSMIEVNNDGIASSSYEEYVENETSIKDEYLLKYTQKSEFDNLANEIENTVSSMQSSVTTMESSVSSMETSVSTLRNKVLGNIEPRDTTFFNNANDVNFLNPATVKDGFINESGSIVEAVGTYKYTDFIRAVPGMYLIYSYDNNGTRASSIQMRFVSCYDDQYVHLRDLSTVNVNNWIIPDGVAYVRISFYANTFDKKPMVEMNYDNTLADYKIYNPDTGIKDEYLTKYALKTDVPTKISELENDSQFATKTEVGNEIDKALISVNNTLTTNSNAIRDIQSDLGTVESLNTENKTVVGAINEVKADKNADTIDNYHIWVGTQAEYDAIATKSNTTLYFIKHS